MSPLSQKTAIFYLAGVFILGAIAGGAIGYSQSRPRPRSFPTAPKPDDYVQNKCDRLTKQLNLTSEQRTKIEPIVRDRMNRMRQLQEESWQRIQEAIRETDQKIQDQLSPEQQKLFIEANRQRMSRGPGIGPGFGPARGPGPNSKPSHDHQSK
jgi:Spy/CpxP family protein refolding chaperone